MSKSQNKLPSLQSARQHELNLKVVYLSTCSIKNHPDNPRTHPPSQIKALAASIKRFGFVGPILIDAGNYVIAGHARLAAAKSLGLTQVPTLRADHLSDIEIKALRIADNKLASKASWDNDLLALVFEEMKELNFDLEATGFDGAEIEVIFNAKDAPSARDASEVLPQYDARAAISQTGDLWLMGDHRLLCGDALNRNCYKTLLDRDKAQLIFTDPPYNLAIEGNVGGLGRFQHRNFAMASGEMSKSGFTLFLASHFAYMREYSVDGSIHFICMDWRHQREILDAGYEVFTELKNVCVWVKPNGGMGSFYRSRHELIFVWKNGRKPHINNFGLGQYGRSRTNVWEYAGVNSFKAGRQDELAMHPTCKPVNLIVDAIKDCSRRNDIVLDPFGGSGSTLMAAEQTHRCARLIEIDPRYCDVIIRRWQNHTGLKAIKESTGEEFDVVERKIGAGEVRDGD
jgi:DNA modification methylase